METKKQNIIIIAVSAVIAISILLIGWKKNDAQHIESSVYRVPGGWGYDILVNKKLFIRQESVPVIQTLHPFDTKEEADQAADIVIKKLQGGHLPTLSKSDLEKILPAHDKQDGQYRKD
ncbi:MAG: DUF4907 domain-containing protein [Chitinophagaceae bacterium]